MRVTIAIAASLAAVAAAAATSVPAPSNDSFYTQPQNVSSYKPGDIISKRQVSNMLSGFIGDGVATSIKASYQYLYRTTDSLGDPVAAVATMLIPYNSDPSKLLAYENAYDSANNDCSPSYAIRSGANTTATDDIVFINAALEKGWYVVTADYEGLQAQYVAGVMSGYATLDSVRAAFNDAKDIGLDPKAKYALWGYSGGSLASEWAAELQPSYAPELKFEGAALGGLVPNVTNILLTITNHFFAGEAFAGILGLSKAFPNLTEYVDQHLIASKKADFDYIGGGCVGDDAQRGAYKNVSAYFDHGLATLDGEIPRSILAIAGQMGVHGTPEIPLFIYKAQGDEISPVADSDELVSQYCSQGVTIEYQRNTVGEHVSEAIFGSGSALAWVEDRLNGKPVANPGKCDIRNVTISALDIPTFTAFSIEAIALLQSLVGGPLGLQQSG